MRASVYLLSLLFITGCASSGGYMTGSPSFFWPVRGGKITQGFKQRSNRHDGLDIAGRKNSPIYAAESGKVIYAGRDFNGYGKLMIIEHAGDTWATFYGHLNSFQVSEGSRVVKGQRIASMGRTGRASGVHLHFEIRYKLRPVNPLQYLGSRQYLSSSH